MIGADSLPTGLNWLLRSSLQGSAIICLVLAVQAGLGKWLKPGWRYALWWLVLIRLAIPYSIQSPASIMNLSSLLPDRTPSIQAETAGEIDIQAPSAEDVARPDALFSNSGPRVPAIPSAIVVADATSTALLSPAGLQSILAWLWLLGAAGLTARILWLGMKAAASFRSLRLVSNAEFLKLLEDCRKTVGLKAAPCILEPPGIRTPALFGFLVPYLLLPPGLIGAFTRDEQRMVLLHELIHIRRRDVVLNWLVTLLQVLHWFNPLVWYACHRLRSDREAACDAAVLSSIGPSQSISYGQTLIKLLEGFSRAPNLPNLVGLLETPHRIKRRISAIAAYPSARFMGMPAMLLLSVLLILAALTDAMPRRQAAIVASRGTPDHVLIRVIDQSTGSPIHGAFVGKIAVTGANGFADASVFFPATVLLRADGYVPRYVKFMRTLAAQPSFVFEMSPARRIGGVVLDDHSLPIKDAGVRVTIQNSVPLEPFDVIGSPSGTFSFKTDSRGRWECREAPGTWVGITFTVVHPEFVETAWGNGTVGPPYGLTREPLRPIEPGRLFDQSAVFELKRGLPLRGRVVDRHGRPIPNASVREGWSFIYGPHERTSTDFTGRFTFMNVASGKITLTAQAPGFAHQTRLVSIHPGMGETVFVLEDGKILKGQIVTPEGRPIQGARLLPDGAPPECEVTLETDSNGFFTWDSAPSRPMQFNLRAYGFRTRSHVWLDPDTPHIRLALGPEPPGYSSTLPKFPGDRSPAAKRY
jgi:beta-lactamase regulating signal transducer with metallopeptidase domain